MGLAVVAMAGYVLAVAALAAGLPWPRPAPAGPLEPVAADSPDCAKAPLTHRAGQVLVVGLPGVHQPDHPLVAEVLGAEVAGILLTKTNVASDAQVRALVAGLRAGSTTPLLLATDEEPGRVSSFGTLLGRTSSARTIARRHDPAEVRSAATELGRALRGYGVDAVFAPVADLDDGPARGIIGDRSFSADPHEAADYALAYSQGLAAAGVLPTAKHFPGHGRTRTDSHRRLEIVDVGKDELLATDAVPFAVQIRAGVPLVMLAHVGYAGLDRELPASLSPAAYAMLRELGFTGVAITDSIGMGAVNLRWDFPDAAVLAVAAGADAVLATDGSQAERMRAAIVRAVDDGRLPESRLDEAVARTYRLRGLDPWPVVCRDAPVPTMAVRPVARMSR
jgi:beta-N-acetylhexosaminidase